MSVRRRLHSSLCSRVTLTVRRENLSISSTVPVSFASSPSSLASARFSNLFDSYKIHNPRHSVVYIYDVNSLTTHHALFHLRRLPVKHISGLDPILHNTNSAVEEPHEMTRGLSSIIGEHLAVLLAHGYEELVDGHGGVDCDFAAEEGFDVMFFDGCGCVFG